MKFLKNCASRIHERRDIRWQYGGNTAENPVCVGNCSMLSAKMAEH